MKIENFDSKILIKETISRFGYDPNQIGKYSKKEVVVSCRFCNKSRTIRMNKFTEAGYTAICKLCRKEEKKQTASFNNKDILNKAINSNLNISDEKKEIKSKKIKSKVNSPEYIKKKNTTLLKKYGTTNISCVEEIKEKKKKTLLFNYGVDNPLKSEEIKDKIKKDCNEKYGKDYFFQTEDFSDKKEKTNLEKYGCLHFTQSEEYKNKVRKTNLDKRNTTHHLKNSEVRNKIISTVIEKYGVDNVFKSDLIKSKIDKTNLEKYGTNSILKLDKIKSKIRKTNLEKYGYEIASKNEIIKQKISKSNIDYLENNREKTPIKNTLENKYFWEMLKTKSLKECCDVFHINYNSLNTKISSDKRYRDRYYFTYSFPKLQKQKEIKDFVKSLGFNCLFSCKSIINIDSKKYELDIYIPDKKFAIEFNGSYYHSTAFIVNKYLNNKITYEEFEEEKRRLKKYHYLKTKLCKEKGIFLLHIFENDWDENKEKIKSFIINKLDQNTTKIPARKCIITDVNASTFIEENHLKGNNKNSVKYINLEYNGEIVASISASKHHRKNESNIIVLSRLVFKKNTTIQGGSSKLFKYLKQWAKEKGYEKIISWSDNTYSYGDIYKKLGFEMKEELPPDYFYWSMKERKYISKQNRKKTKINCPKPLTELQFSEINKIYPIYDCGKIRWEYSL